MSRQTLVRVSIFLATVAATWGVLSLGAEAPAAPDLNPGDPAPQDFFAEREARVQDQAELVRLQEEARAAIDEDEARERNTEIEEAVMDSVQRIFADVKELVLAEPPIGPVTTIPELPAEEEEAEPAEEVEPATIFGRVFVDVDGDGVYSPEGEGLVDRGLEGVAVEVRTSEDDFAVVTAIDGSWEAEIPGTAAVVVVSGQDQAVPRGFIPGTDNLAQLIECSPGEQCSAGDVGFVPNLRPAEQAEASLGGRLPVETTAFLVQTARQDVIREAIGMDSRLEEISRAAIGRVQEEFAARVTPEGLEEARNRQRTSPPTVFEADGIDQDGSQAAGEVVATFLLPNWQINIDRLEALREAAAEAVEVPEVTYGQTERIVSQGERLTALHIAAIEATRLGSVAEQGSGGLLAVIAVLVVLLGLYLARFRPEFWARPRMVALLGILVLLAAGAVRGTTAIVEATSLYVLPAVAFGLMTAVLFDQRIALLMALAVGVLTAAGTTDLGITTYAVLAAIAPIPFVSSVSSRGAFRTAVAMSSLAAAVVAAATSWTFHVGPDEMTLQVVGASVAWAFGVSAVASMIGLAALQFFESAFDVTTTLSLLDLTDRNHKALQLIQEKAFGTFNHSLMVGTLADAAARAIGANTLLARAMAYYHDIGKTENPTYFIENQFGIPNPHDTLDPKESAEIIRSHVTDGVALARRFKIPTEVTQGIVSHHGDGVMRYFYEKARRIHGEHVSVEDYRHVGHKPRTPETAILMLADSLEAACRAEFQSREPTGDAIEKVIDRIMEEKVEDGQLSEAPVTLAELTKIRKAFLESLVGHYHQRIAYPNFPGT